MKEFKGKVAIVTGGADGIGRAAAVGFGRFGANVVIGDVSVEGGHETVKLIESAGGSAMFVKTDVSDKAQVEALVRAAVKGFGRVDYGVNNAGIDGAQADTAEYPEEVWDNVLGVNLKGVWLCMKYEIPEILKAGRGAIVNTASMCGVVAFSKISAYNASKFGVIGVTKTAALEYADRGIRVNAVCPGWVDTAMTVRESHESGIPLEEFRRMAGRMVPMNRMSRPEEISEGILWLCSDAASYVTGSAMMMDGASTAGWCIG